MKNENDATLFFLSPNYIILLLFVFFFLGGGGLHQTKKRNVINKFAEIARTGISQVVGRGVVIVVYMERESYNWT